MDSNEYHDLIINLINNGENVTPSNYIKTVGRQLTVFSSEKKIKDYIKGKIFRIYGDYNIKSIIKWNNSVNNVVKINKSNEVSLPSFYLSENKEHYLTDIPYGIALFLYKTNKSERNTYIPLIYWLSFVTFNFFNLNISDSFQFLQVESLHFTSELIKSKHYIEAKKGVISYYKDEKLKVFYSKGNDTDYFYMKYDKRHLLFSLIIK